MPLHKRGPYNYPNNYRPISVLSIFIKLLTRVIHDQVYEYLNTSDLPCQRQLGFRKTHSISTCLVEFLDVENGRLNEAVFFDLKKAFDTVNHRILCCKLSAMGLANSSIMWFESYLANRSQVTKIGTYLSPSSTISSGVPQGSILGPYFSLYT